MQEPRIIHQQDCVLLEHLSRHRLAHTLRLLKQSIQLLDSSASFGIRGRRIKENVATVSHICSLAVLVELQELAGDGALAFVELWGDAEVEFVGC
jgi:hypothetical protein